MFIPTQVVLVPTIFVLKSLGLMGTLPGLVLFQAATMMIPFTLFVFTGYIRMLPKSLDEAAAVDGAGHYYILWRIIGPLMTPIIATVFVLNSLSAWNDFASPQLILGPGSQFYTVTTGVYAAVGQFSADYTRVYPTLLLAVIPIQRPSGSLSFIPEWVCSTNPAHRWRMATAARVQGSDCPMCQESGKSQVELLYFEGVRAAFGEAFSGLAMRHPAFTPKTGVGARRDGEPPGRADAARRVRRGLLARGQARRRRQQVV